MDFLIRTRSGGGFGGSALKGPSPRSPESASESERPPLVAEVFRRAERHEGEGPLFVSPHELHAVSVWFPHFLACNPTYSRPYRLGQVVSAIQTSRGHVALQVVKE